MARNLLYHLNRLQDVLSLPRTLSGKYPVNDDPLHGDDVLTDDIWEASKLVTGDLARRGLMDVVSTSAPIARSQNAYTLPSNVCRLHSVEYFDGTSWRGPLVSIHYDDYVRISASETEGTPQYYTHTLSDSREVFLTISEGVTQSSFRDTGSIIVKSDANLTATSSGEQINRDDLVFNVTQDSGGVVDHLDMSSARYSSSSTTVRVEHDYVANSIEIDDNSMSSTSDLEDFARVGDIFLEGKTWVVITGASFDPNFVLELTHDGVIRGDLDKFTINGSHATTGVTIGDPDRLVVKSDDPFVLEANQGFSGGVTDILETYVTGDGAVFLVSSQLARIDIWDLSRDIDLSAYNSNGYTATVLRDNGAGNPDIVLKAYVGLVGVSGTQLTPSYDFSQVSFYSDPSLGTRGFVDSDNNAVTDLGWTCNGVTITKPPLFVGDIVQVESQFATLDTIQVFPYPDINDVTGAEGLRMTYVPYPAKPTKSDQMFELPDAFNDAILSKAHEYATRREINRVEPYEDSIRRATSIARPLPSSGLMRNRRGGVSRGINFVVPS